MKKLTYLLGFGAIASLFVFNSCTPDEDAVGPSLTITSGESVTVKPHNVIVIKWRADAGDAKLANFTIKEGNATIVDENIRDWNQLDIPNAQNETYIDSAVVQVGNEDTEFTLVVTDKDDLIATKTVTVTIDLTQTGNLVNHEGIILGAQNNATGSFFASFEGDIYTINELKTGGYYNKVDIIYYYGNTNKQALFSPKSIVDNNITWGGSIPVANWGANPNETLFKKGSSDDYDNASYGSLSSFVSGADITIANGGRNPVDGLKSGDVYGFLTDDGKSGVFEVKAAGADATGTIEIDVKIQE